MSQQYFCDFDNKTHRTWTMALYQTLPDSPGLDSVSWLQTTVPQSGSSGVRWNVDYDVLTADYQQDGGRGVYRASQTLPTLLGKKWNCVFKDGVQQLKEAGSAPAKDAIVIDNRSDRTANLGIGMSGQGSVYKRDVNGGAQAQFTVKPTYWLGLFNNVERGQVISSNVVVGPFELKYVEGLNLATATARLEGENVKVDIKYGQRMDILSSAGAFDAEALEARLERRLGRGLGHRLEKMIHHFERRLEVA